MAKLAVQFLDQALHRAVFDAMPLPIFIVDPDVSILEYNSAAAQFLRADKKTVLKRRGGEVLHCIHSAEVPEGCGRAPACSSCVVRNAVKAAVAGHRVSRKSARMERIIEGKRTKVNLRVTSQPFSHQGHSFVLLVFEGLRA
jgi:PAS domain-containing protein